MTAAPNERPSYRRLFAQPALRRLAVADGCARLPQGMLNITLLLVAARHHSLVTAGLVVSGYAIGQGLTAPIRGRIVDRRGLARVAAPCLVAYGLALIGLLVASQQHASPGWLLVCLAGAAGLVTPPLSPAMRSLWATRTVGALRHTAFSLDAAIFDLAYILGPALASTLATGLVPAVAVFTLLALVVVAVVVVSVDPDAAVRVEPGPTVERLAVLRSKRLRRLMVSASLVNLTLAAIEVSLTSYAKEHHSLWASGPLLAGISIGSVLGSLAFGARHDPAHAPHQRLPWLVSGYALGLAVLTICSGYPPLLAVAVPLAGLGLGPTLATIFTTAADAAPAGMSTETQSWVNTMMSGGAAAGAALAALASHRPVLGFALSAAVAGIAALIAALS